VEKLQRGMQAQPTSGTIPELVQLLQQAALATEAEGRDDLAGALRWWAERLKILEQGEAPCQSELWLG
jgi:hypothetical protein